MIRWNLPNKQNTLEYHILKYKPATMSKWDTIKFEDLNLISFHDSLFEGAPTLYKVAWVGYDYYMESSEIEASIDHKSYIEFQIKDNLVTISSPNFPLYNNNLKTTIYYLNGENSESTYLTDGIFKYNDDIPIYFGEQRSYNITYTAIVDKSSVYSTGIGIGLNIGVGKEIHPFYASYAFENKGIIVNIDINGIYKYDMKTMTLLDSLIVDTFLDKILASPNGEYFYKVSNTIDRIDLETMELSMIYKISDIYPQGCDLSCREYSMSNWVTNTNVIRIADNLIDLNDGSRILPIVNQYWVPHMSPDSKFILQGEYDTRCENSCKILYHWNGNNYEKLGKLQNYTNQSRVKFFNSYNQLHMLTEEGDIYELNNLLVQNGIISPNANDRPNFGAHEFFKFDYTSNSLYAQHVLTDKKAFLKVYDPLTWELISDHIITPAFLDEIYTYKGLQYFYHSGKLLATSGAYLNY